MKEKRLRVSHLSLTRYLTQLSYRERKKKSTRSSGPERLSVASRELALVSASTRLWERIMKSIE